MKGKGVGLFVKVLAAIALGAAVGMFLPACGVRALKTFNVLFAQFLKFVIPLLILGLVTPAIASVGRGAGKLLVATMLAAYASSVAAGLFAWGIAQSLFPHVLPTGISAAAQGGREFLPYVTLKIPPVCDVMTALTLAFVAGVGMSFVGGGTLRKWFDDLGEVVKLTIEKAVIPLLPVYIFTMVTEMSASGKVGALVGSFVKVIATGVAVSILFLVIEFVLAGLIARKNPFKCLWNMLPAYLTGFSICSSAPVIPITLEAVKRNGASEEIADFVVPLCANVHMPGSVIKMATCVTAVAYMTGFDLTPALFVNFVLLQCISAVSAPGVATGVLMASVGLLESVIGFSAEQTALLMTVYLALDGYGPACSVTADGALVQIADRFFGPKQSKGRA